MIDRCVRKDFMSCDPSQPYHWRSHPRQQVKADAVTVTSGVHPHAPVNHMVFFYAIVLFYLCI